MFSLLPERMFRHFYSNSSFQLEHIDENKYDQSILVNIYASIIRSDNVGEVRVNQRFPMFTRISASFWINVSYCKV